MRSYWEATRLLHRDLVIVGGGLVGLQLARAVKARDPAADVLVVERGLLPTGATTRSAGFACLGSLTELLADVDAHGLDATLTLVAQRHAGLLRLREGLGDAAIGYQPTGGWELLGPERAHALDRLDALDAALRPITGGPALVRADAELGRFGFGDTAHLVALPHEGALDPGRLARALHAAVRAADVDRWTGATVTHLEDDADGVTLAIAADGASLSVRARQVAVCTNAFAVSLLPELEVTPGRGQVLVTEPVAGLPFRGVFHRDEGYVYFREVDGRVLLGGARHLDPAGETSTALALHGPIQAELDRLLAEVVLPGREVRVAQRWAGVMGFGPQRAPIVARVRPRVVAGVRLGGMGIALGTDVAQQVADLLADG